MILKSYFHLTIEKKSFDRIHLTSSIFLLDGCSVGINWIIRYSTNIITLIIEFEIIYYKIILSYEITKLDMKFGCELGYLQNLACRCIIYIKRFISMEFSLLCEFTSTKPANLYFIYCLLCEFISLINWSFQNR